MPEAIRPVLRFLAREWWVVTLAVVAAVVVASVMSPEDAVRSPSFEGRAEVTVEPKTLSSYYRLPKVDELLEDVQSDEFLARAAEELELEAGVLRRGLRAFSVNSPQTEVIVSFRSSDATEALRIVDGFAEQVRKRAIVLGDKEISSQRRQIKATEAAIEDVEALSSAPAAALSEWQRISVVQDMWSMRLKLESFRRELDKMETAYSYSGRASVEELPAIKRQAAGTGGAALAGLAVGLALAGLREAYLRRRMVDPSGADGEH